MIGRISTCPACIGIRVADVDRLVAVVGLDQEYPPSCSRSPQMGRSVTSLLLSRTRTLIALDVACNGDLRRQP